VRASSVRACVPWQHSHAPATTSTSRFFASAAKRIVAHPVHRRRRRRRLRRPLVTRRLSVAAYTAIPTDVDGAVYGRDVRARGRQAGVPTHR